MSFIARVTPRRPIASVMLMVLLAACSSTSGAGNSDPGNHEQKVDEIVVVTSNVHQFKLDVSRMRTLAWSLNAVTAGHPPDVIFLQEIESDGVRELARVLNDIFPEDDFGSAGPLTRHVKAKAIVNLAANDVDGFSVWTDACDTRNRYLELRLSVRDTGARYSAAGVHLPWDAISECRERNAALLKEKVAINPTIIAGDFNSRAVVEQRECDLAETSEPLGWYSILTSDTGGPAFRDSVKTQALKTEQPVGEQWTYEGIGPTEICDGSSAFRRNRIDYIFVRGVSVLDAGADDPGWAGATPGTFTCSNEEECRYSDHRFVVARLGLEDD